MEANELRIGNIVKHQNSICVTRGVLNDTDLFVCNDYEEWYPVLSECNPIPITEEWLLKFGFKKHITSDIHPTFALKSINVNDGIVYVIGYGFLNHIKYVYQLQNLYFALTGEELTLK